MRKLTKILTPAIAAIGMVTMVPGSAMAASHDTQNASYSRHDQRDTRGYDQGGSIRSDIAALTGDIKRAERNRTISSREAQSLRRDAAQVKKLYSSYARNGLNHSEIGTLSKRVDRIERALRDTRGNTRRDSDRHGNDRRDTNRRG